MYKVMYNNKIYNMIEIDFLTKEEIISRIQFLYFNIKNINLKKTFKYSQLLNKLEKKQMCVKLINDYKDLILFSEQNNIQEYISKSIK